MFGMYKRKTPFIYDEGAFDWSIFNTIAANKQTGCNIGHLNQICDKMMLPWLYKPDAEPALASRHFKAFFQLATPFRIATIDGQHRQFMANKIFQGYSISDSTFPLDVLQASKDKLPAHSTLFQNTQLVVLTPKGTKKITKEVLGLAKNLSLKTQELKNESNYEQTFKALLLQIYTILDATAYTPSFDSHGAYWEYPMRGNPSMLPGKKLPDGTNEGPCKWSMQVNSIVINCITQYYTSAIATVNKGCTRAEAYKEVRKAYENRSPETSGRNFKAVTQVSHGKLCFFQMYHVQC